MPTTETMPTTGTPSAQPDTTAAGDSTPAQMCDVCSHPMSDHDVISARFCAATVAGALTRGCVCPRR